MLTELYHSNYCYLRKNQVEEFKEFIFNNSLNKSNIVIHNFNNLISKMEDGIIKIVYTEESNTLSWCKVDEMKIFTKNNKHNDVKMGYDSFINTPFDEFKDILLKFSYKINMNDIHSFELYKNN
jgi:hypothetical protein